MGRVSSEPFFGQVCLLFHSQDVFGYQLCKLPELVSLQGGKEPKHLAVLQDFSCPQASKPNSAMIHPTFRAP